MHAPSYPTTGASRQAHPFFPIITSSGSCARVSTSASASALSSSLSFPFSAATSRLGNPNSPYSAEQFLGVGGGGGVVGRLGGGGEAGGSGGRGGRGRVGGGWGGGGKVMLWSLLLNLVGGRGMGFMLCLFVAMRCGREVNMAEDELLISGGMGGWVGAQR